MERLARLYVVARHRPRGWQGHASGLGPDQFAGTRDHVVLRTVAGDGGIRVAHGLGHTPAYVVDAQSPDARIALGLAMTRATATTVRSTCV